MWWANLLLALVSLMTIIAAACAYGSSRWKAATAEMPARLEAARRPIFTKKYSAADLIGLPPPVQRYFHAALTDGQPVVAGVQVEHRGAFNLSDSAELWRPFTSVQHVFTRRPGFDWDARIEMLPGLPLRVHDAYIGGEGILQVTLCGLIPLAKMRGTPEIAQGELLRFLIEAAWYPTALLPSQGVLWEAVDDTSARATLADGTTTASLLVRFNEHGLIASLRAETRSRVVHGKTVPTPWEGRLSHYEVRDGMRIPLEGEVAWILPAGPRPYWRGRITSIDYRFAQ